MDNISIHKRNFLALIMEGTFFYTGMAFIDVNAVIPVFIFTYTRSLKLVGLATTINLAASVAAQILVGPYVKSIRNIRTYIVRMMFIFRVLPALMIPVLLAGFAPYATVAAFLLIYALIFIGDGLTLIPWNDLLGRTILPDERGRLLGNQQIVGGIGCLGAGFLIKSLLENEQLTDTARYSFIFGGAAFFLVIASVCMSFARDNPRTVSLRPPSNWHYYRQMPAYLKKNKEFSKMAVIKILSSFAGIATPFLILFGQNNFRLGLSQVSTLVYLQIIGSLVGGFAWGVISKRFGSKYVIITAQITSLVILSGALACFILREHAVLWFIMWPLILLNGMNMGSWIGPLNYIFDIVNEEDRTVYLLLANMITFPLTILTFLAGIIADITGFVPLFLVGLLAASTAVFLSRRLKSPKQLLDLWEEQKYD